MNERTAHSLGICTLCERPKRRYLDGTLTMLYCTTSLAECLYAAHQRQKLRAVRAEEVALDAIAEADEVTKTLGYAERRALVAESIAAERLKYISTLETHRLELMTERDRLRDDLDHHRKLLNDALDLADDHAAVADRYEEVLREVDRMCNEDFTVCSRCHREEPLKDLDLHYIVRNALQKVRS